MNKKGGDKIISVYWFAILFIVAAGIVYMVLSFYGKPYDVREIEVDLLTDKVAGCLSSSGYINENWQNFNENNVLDECELNFNVENTGGWNNDQYYIKIEIFDFNSGQNLKEVFAGNRNLNIDCSIKSTNFPICLEREMYSIDKENNQYKIKILSIVRKTEKNA